MKFKVGNIVRYHPVIGQEHDGKEYIIWFAQKVAANIPKDDYQWAYWLIGKAGFVVERALSLSRETQIDKMKLRVEMDDGSRWDVPVSVIAIYHAKYYAKALPGFDGNVVQSYLENTVPLFQECHDDIISWARAEMNWSEVEKYAVKVDPDLPVDYQSGWLSGYKEVICG